MVSAIFGAINATIIFIFIYCVIAFIAGGIAVSFATEVLEWKPRDATESFMAKLWGVLTLVDYAACVWLYLSGGKFNGGDGLSLLLEAPALIAVFTVIAGGIYDATYKPSAPKPAVTIPTPTPSVVTQEAPKEEGAVTQRLNPADAPPIEPVKEKAGHKEKARL